MTETAVNPFCSIIVPVYNTAPEYVKVCLDSLTAQTYGNIEILLVDDGSREELAARYRALAAEDERITLLRQENAGVSAARNKGLKAAKGEWVWFVDADDWVEKNACERAFALLKDSPVDMVLFREIREYESTQKIFDYPLTPGKIYDLSVPAVKKTMYENVTRTSLPGGAIIFFTWSKFFRRAFLTEHGLTFTPGITKGEDRLFFLSWLEKHGTFLFIEDTLYHYRVNTAGLCHGFNPNADKDRIRYLFEVKALAERMDKELSADTGAPYAKLTQEYRKLCFSILSDVLRQKYYHADNPNKKTRRRDAVAFLHTEPFREALYGIPYRELGGTRKLKKFMLTHGFVSVSAILLQLQTRLKGYEGD